MAYIGASPTYGVFDRQVLTGDGSTTTYSLDHMGSYQLHCWSYWTVLFKNQNIRIQLH